MTNLLYVRLQERTRSKKDVIKPWMTHSVEFCCVSIATRRDPVPFGSAYPEVSFSVKDLGSQWMGPTPRPLLRGRPCEKWWTQHLELYVGTFLSCVVLWWKLLWEDRTSPVTSHSIYSVTKPNSTTVHLWGSLSRQHCPLWEPLSDLRSHDDPSCLCRESLRINFGTGFSCLWVDKYVWWRIQIFLLVRLPTWDFSEDLLEYMWSSDEQRVSVLIGNHQPIGVAQTKRVSVPIGSQLIGTAQMKCARLRHGSHRSHGSEEWATSPTRTFTRASMTTKVTSVCDGRQSFRHFCHLPFVVLFWCEWSYDRFQPCV